MRTLQEKYNAVLEGKFSKTQFRRDAAIEMPQFVSTVNSFDDTVSILKNKGAITEAKKPQEPKYTTASPEDYIAPDVLDTGIKFELDKKYGTLDVTPEQYEKCKEMAIKNLSKDVLYYVKQDSVQLEAPGEKMEKAKLNEEVTEDVRNIESDQETKRRIARLTNELLKDADPRDEAVKAYAISVKNDLESGDASRMTQYKNILSLDDLKDDMEHYITHDVDQLEEKELDATEKAASAKIGAGEEFTDDDAAAVADKMPKIKKDAIFTLMREEEDYKALKEMFKKIIVKVIND
jgi:hypothetical protein